MDDEKHIKELRSLDKTIVLIIAQIAKYVKIWYSENKIKIREEYGR